MTAPAHAPTPTFLQFITGGALEETFRENTVEIRCTRCGDKWIRERFGVGCLTTLPMRDREEARWHAARCKGVPRDA